MASRDSALDFTIPPSFAQTRWFLAVWIAALAGLAWLAYLARMREVAGGLRVRYQAALAERTRIAQDLHDTLLQGFTGITLQLRAIERSLAQRPQESAQALKKVLASADTALRDARHMIWDMRAVELEGRDLAEALEVAARHAMADSTAELVFTVRPPPAVARHRDDGASGRPRGGAQCREPRSPPHGRGEPRVRPPVLDAARGG